MWTVQTLVANNTVPIACTTQGTTVQDTAKSATKKLDLQRLASHEPQPGHLQESSLQMASCREAKYKGAEKASSVDYLTALSNVQRNAAHVVKSFHIPHRL